MPTHVHPHTHTYIRVCGKRIIFFFVRSFHHHRRDLAAAFFRGYALSLYRFAGRYRRAELGKALPRPCRRRHRHRDDVRPRTDGTAKEERKRPKTVFDALTQTAVNYFTYSRVKYVNTVTYFVYKRCLYRVLDLQIKKKKKTATLKSTET